MSKTFKRISKTEARTFIQDDSIVLPQMKQVNLPSGRVYQIESGKHVGACFPSITTVLKAKPKPQLEAWKQRVGALEAAKISSRAAARGSALHKHAEDYLANKELSEISPSAAELWALLRPWIDKHVSRVYAQEANVYSAKLGVAGRFDLLAEVDSESLAIVDFKQSNRPKREEYVEDYYLQGTFYSAAVYELTGRAAKRIIFPIASPEGLQVFEVKPRDRFSMLLRRINEYYNVYA